MTSLPPQKKYVSRYFFLTALLFITGCNEYYLQHASILTIRKAPTITTTQRNNGFIDIEISGAYSREKTATYNQGNHTEYVSADGEFDYDCASNPDCNDTLVNNIPFRGDNIEIRTTQWNANLQLSLVPFYLKKKYKTYRLRILAEAQYGRYGNTDFWNFKFGPTCSFIRDHFAIHPKIILGYSIVDGKYYELIKSKVEHGGLFFDSTYYTYTWRADSGAFYNSRRICIESGATIEWRMNETFSILSDISFTYQHLFTYDGDVINMDYTEFSPAIKLSASKYLTIIAGVSLPHNFSMNSQLPIQGFSKIHFSAGTLR